ncbi:uncharacterized protein LOC128383421 [Scomber japonicus]|uniref:uncharacterized protein LOC128383421 n=1 Tax=Scomber japonicus TaxID=13676 RepID=UPI002306B4D9|nr:uncharacterized protein LOC128383421 [Scomber japonicus]
MTSPNLVLYLAFLFLGRMAQATNEKSSSFHQENSFISANVGESLTLQCFYKDDYGSRLYWYKQTLGQKPRLMSTLYVFSKNGTFHDEFKNNPRFKLDTTSDKNHLTITNLDISDSATYYCVSCYANILEFLVDTTIHVKGSAWMHQSATESIQPGGSVTLNCTVHTGTCDDGEHSVYWFKYSEESHPGLIYTHGGRNDQCERNTNTQTHTCVYNLPMKSLNLSHAGTYYCAVASCGHILFGNGTKLDFEHEVDSLVLVYFLSGALAFTTILSVLLAISMYKMNKRQSCQSETQHGFAAPSTADAEGYQDTDNLQYAAVSANAANRSRKVRNTNSECVYASVKM